MSIKSLCHVKLIYRLKQTSQESFNLHIQSYILKLQTMCQVQECLQYLHHLCLYHNIPVSTRSALYSKQPVWTDILMFSWGTANCHKADILDKSEKKTPNTKNSSP